MYNLNQCNDDLRETTLPLQRNHAALQAVKKFLLDFSES